MQTHDCCIRGHLHHTRLSVLLGLGKGYSIIIPRQYDIINVKFKSNDIQIGINLFLAFILSFSYLMHQVAWQFYDC